MRAFPGDLYAQVIGRSDQSDRFQDGDYANVFAQAKELGIRYIEPWEMELTYHTHDALLEDFNQWSSSAFAANVDGDAAGNSHISGNPQGQAKPSPRSKHRQWLRHRPPRTSGQ